MRTRSTRLAGVGAALAVVGTTAWLGAGTAAAAEPVVLGECRTTVRGEPGTPLALSASAVLGPVTDLVRAVPLLGPGLAEPFRAAFAALPPIPIGAIPTGEGVVTGGQIAARVNGELGRLPLLGPVLTTVTGGVGQVLGGLCSVTAIGVNAAVAPVQEGVGGVADASEAIVGQVLPPAPQQPAPQQPAPPVPQPQQPPAPQPEEVPARGVPQGSTTATASAVVAQGRDLLRWGANFGGAPAFGYGSLPFAAPGLFSPVPRGETGGPGAGRGLPRAADREDVREAGRAQALPGLANGVATPVLLAVVLLACVTGALVRTWVLRRPSVR
ncbi:hypothetical protein [Actinosynnema mirum]|uniref:TAF4A RNA polymerase II, TATA box binding protein (TBP)-associated factor n=1 Tax=Actinosynnema mirum (strain ATCC 29888 / DSM 43827 / JCM 3225 / NBRC 14064 / NCIMB 13271 / NRRL B-12336 / IMRU 3971 / 101) TaxID=446462 RepID=C6WSG0_ACTMD|nr:hypothetical protein [Actinosynnema mirum]ACU40830.1 TAF4A RNA polymerase II, TATA box binding protein (TBP)-associated factor [Actinosynnema mirum DSM 43827]